jgi:hypothetical protein
MNPVDSISVEPSNSTRVMQDSFLEKAPESYISARHLHKEFDIWASTARAWRNRGKVRAKKVGATWFYSRQDLSELVAQLNRKMYPITIDGRPTTLRDIRSIVFDTVLKKALGDYISAKDVRNKAGIKNATLRRWRDSGKLRAKKIRNTWYYSRQDLLQLLKTESNRLPKSE